MTFRPHYYLALFLCFYSTLCFIIKENQLTLQTIYAYYV